MVESKTGREGTAERAGLEGKRKNGQERQVTRQTTKAKGRRRAKLNWRGEDGRRANWRKARRTREDGGEKMHGEIS